MKNIITKAAAIAATAAVVSGATFVNTTKASAATYNLSWQGNNGYTATGAFSFEDALSGLVITKDQLSSFNISFFNPSKVKLGTFDYKFPLADTDDFLFNFDSAKGIIRQTAGYDDVDNGFDLGINVSGKETGLDFFTSNGSPATATLPVGTVVLQDNLKSFGCNTFPSSNCNRLDIGGKLTATKSVPEPASVLGLLAVGVLGGTLKKKLASTQQAKLRDQS